MKNINIFDIYICLYVGYLRTDLEVGKAHVYDSCLWKEARSSDCHQSALHFEFTTKLHNIATKLNSNSEPVRPCRPNLDQVLLVSRVRGAFFFFFSLGFTGLIHTSHLGLEH